jgi:hypothetical protein
VPLPESFAAAPPALTSLRMSNSGRPNVSGLTGLRRLEVQVMRLGDDDACTAVKGLSGLTALEDLRLEDEFWPLAQPSDLAPLTALSRLAMTALPPELGSHPMAARLRRLELQAFHALNRAPDGTAAAALAALARGATLLEHLVFRVSDGLDGMGEVTLQELMRDHPDGITSGAALGAAVVWPSLTHLEVTAWAALLLASCTFPRLSRLSAYIVEKDGEEGALYNVRLRTAVAALAAKARDHAALRFIDGGDGVFHAAGALAAAAAPPGLRHVSWLCGWRGGAAEAPPCDWAHLAASLESLELVGCLPAFGYAEPLAALTGLTRLHLAAEAFGDEATFGDGASPPQGAGAACEGDEPRRGPAGGALVRAARALARLPRLTHLRLTADPLDVLPRRPRSDPAWGSPLVAAALASCPALRVLEVCHRDEPLWRHEAGPAHGAARRTPLPPSRWTAFAEALRAGGSGAALRPTPEMLAPNASSFLKEFDVEC